MKKLTCSAVALLLTILLSAFTAEKSMAAEEMSTTAGKIRILLENDALKVVEVKRSPGTKVPMHTHPPYIAYFPGPWEGKFTSPEGKTAEKSFQAGDLICSPKGKTHALEVIGTTDQEVVVVEFKNLSEISCEGKGKKE